MVSWIHVTLRVCNSSVAQSGKSGHVLFFGVFLFGFVNVGKNRMRLLARNKHTHRSRIKKKSQFGITENVKGSRRLVCAQSCHFYVFLLIFSLKQQVLPTVSLCCYPREIKGWIENIRNSHLRIWDWDSLFESSRKCYLGQKWLWWVVPLRLVMHERDLGGQVSFARIAKLELG